MKRKDKLLSLMLLGFGVLFVSSAYMVGAATAQARRERKNFERLEEKVKESFEDPDPAQARKEPETGENPSPYAVLKEENPDFFGWIAIDGTRVDYPVMHTPEDEEYYLRRDFDREDSQSGVPFLAAACYEGCGNYLIYGHNMKNGSMFAALLSYADREFWERHPTIRFDTLSGSGEYTVAAAFYAEAYPQSAADVFRFYQYTDLNDPDTFTEYMEQIQSAALYDTGIRAEYGDSLLTLITCSYHTENGRFVVVARREEG